MPTDRPNVLVLLSDEHSVRFQERIDDDHGEPTRTPTIDGLAAAGTDFEEAYCQVPLCGPSRDCLLTSRDQRTCGSWINEDVLDPSLPTLPGTFSTAGYETCLVGKMHFAGEYQFYGFDHRPYGDLTGGTGHQWEPLDPDERASLWGNAGVTSVPEGQLQEHQVVRESLAWLREHEARSDTPWLLCASFSRPHFPLTAPRRYVERFWNPAADEPTDRFTDPPVGVEGDTVDHPMVRAVRERASGEDVDEQTRRFARACYFACVEFLDEVLGEFLALAERDGLLDNTIIVYTSDHGELAGEHGLWGKKTWHEASTRVPFVVVTPGQRRGANDAHRVETPVSLADSFPTLCGLCGVETPADLDGTDLAGAVESGDEPDRGPVVCDYLFPEWGEGHEYRMVREGRYKYVGFRDAPELLFDLAVDPFERRNLADEEQTLDADGEAALERLREFVATTIDFEAAAEECRDLEVSVPEEHRLDGPLGSGNCYRLPDGRIVDADTPLYDPTVLVEHPEDTFADWPDAE